MPRLSNGSHVSPLTTDPGTGAAFRSRVERVQSHDMPALGELFAEYGDLVYRAALRLTGSRPDAEDVTQEVGVRLRPSVTGAALEAMRVKAEADRKTCMREASARDSLERAVR
ncbi:hypothetical protein BH11GEM1_BH11GEM1_33770 [soil metagenome]